MQQNTQIAEQTYTLLNGEYVTMPLQLAEPRIEYMYGLIVVAAFMAIIAVLRITDTSLFKTILNGMFKYKNSESLLGTGYATLGHRLLLLTLSFASIAILITYITSNNIIDTSTGIIFAILFVMHYSTIGIYKYLGWVFNNPYVAKLAGINLWLSNISYGIFVTPIVLSLFFIRPSWHAVVMKITFTILIFLFIVRIFRWLRILFQNRVFILYIFLYLCGLEIAPLILLIKMLAQ